MARIPVFLSPHNFKQRNSFAVEFTFLIVTVFNKSSVEYTSRIFSLSLFLLSSAYLTYGEKSPISSDLQRLIEIVFVAQLQTLHEIPHRENNLGELNW